MDKSSLYWGSSPWFVFTSLCEQIFLNDACFYVGRPRFVNACMYLGLWVWVYERACVWESAWVWEYEFMGRFWNLGIWTYTHISLTSCVNVCEKGLGLSMCIRSPGTLSVCVHGNESWNAYFYIFVGVWACRHVCMCVCLCVCMRLCVDVPACVLACVCESI